MKKGDKIILNLTIEGIFKDETNDELSIQTKNIYGIYETLWLPKHCIKSEIEIDG